jgi:E3 ubiquitin ligase
VDGWEFPLEPGILHVAILIAGAVVGVLVFLRGFRVYGEYRLLTDTPEQPISSLPMGRVRFHGKASAEKLTKSPLTSTPCVYWRTEVHRGTSIVGARSSGNTASDEDSVPFVLTDMSGRVALNPHGAELDLKPTFDRISSESFAPMRQKYFGEGDPLMALPGQVADGAVAAYAESLLEKQRAMKQGPLGRKLEAVKEMVSPREEFHVEGFFSSDNDPPSGPKYHVKEYCILPGHWYEVMGTCFSKAQEAGQPSGATGLIAKGENDPTFLISWRGEAEIEGKLRRSIWLHFLGGLGLTLYFVDKLLRAYGLL